MRLTQIKLSGFKSFVDPITIPVPSQLVGVVGPNGCGKSNIMDAVRWVLGETKASELRGESMQDVIFNGGGSRKAAARASVELVFDNSSGRAAGQWRSYAEIAVRRVLTRTGESSYFINNQAVRRRDIHDIFLGTGLGAKGYAIIGQGMINRLIEAKPEELRVYLEEAAGVSRYKERRRETENRLSDTRDKLARLGDIMYELEHNLEKLARQAEVAQTYRKLQSDGQDKQHLWWYLREENALQDVQKSRATLAQKRADLEASSASLRHAELQIETQRQAMDQAKEAMYASQNQLFQANALVASIEAQIKHIVESRERLQHRQSQLKTQMLDWQSQLDYAQEQRETLFAKIEEDQALIEEAQAVLDSLQDNFPQYEVARQRWQQERETRREKLSTAEQELALVSQRIQDIHRQLQALEVKYERLKAQCAEIAKPDELDLVRLRTALASAVSEKSALRQEIEQIEAQLPEADVQRQQAQQVWQSAQTDLTKLDARLHTLQALQEDIQSKGKLATWLNKHGLSGLNRLWQKIHTDRGWEVALEAILQERMNALELRQLSMSRAFAQDSPPVRMAFYEKPSSVATVAVPSSAWVPLIQYVRCEDSALATLLAKWLEHVFVVETVQEALDQRSLLDEHSCFVLREGHVIDKHSVRFYAPDEEQSGLLARQQEIDNLQKELKAAQLLLDEKHQLLTRAESHYHQLSQSLAPQRHRLSDLTQREHTLQLEVAQLEQRALQAAEQTQRLEAEIEENRFQQESYLAENEQAQDRFAELDEQLAIYAQEHEDALLELENVERTFEQQRQQIHKQEQILQEAGFALRSSKARLEELARQEATATNEIARARSEIEDVAGELFGVQEQASEVGLQDAIEQRSACEEALAVAREQLQAREDELRTLEEQRLYLEQGLEPMRQVLVDLQLKEQAAQLLVEQFSAEIQANELDREALKSRLAELPEAHQKATWLQQEIQRISRQIDALGAVNLAALDELQAERERQQHLQAQHDDLHKAIHTLENAISEIDRETRQLLESTFNEVNANLSDMFPRLFGGGQAKLIMTGTEILDSGVQIMAQPPGKRNSTIYLLSGGEKALTAIALVFSLFKLNPAPFCLLDEVDAPLDDANTERYANLVSSMSHHTQFLFISHNKIAMQMAQQLIGVTMQEQGVSRIVAVDIEAALQLANEN